MRTINITALESELLVGTDAVMLFGISWREVVPTDQMTRLTLVISDPPGRDVPRAFDVLMHRVTRLQVSETGEHIAPAELTQQDQTYLDGKLYDILRVVTASWEFFQSTHQF